jgi:hypothetical protein
MSEAGSVDSGRKYEVNSRRAHLSAYVLVAGLVLELINAIVWFKGPETIAEMVAVLLIVGGVWGEVFFGHKARIAGDEQLSKYEARTAEANQRAQEAALELEKFRQPRSLTPAARARVADKIDKFRPLKFSAAVNPGDPEFVQCLRHIELALQEAGWAQVDWEGDGLGADRSSVGLPMIGLNGSVRNVGIFFVLEDSSNQYEEAAVALMNALVAEGIVADARVTLAESWEIPAQIPIHIAVGTKT